MVARAAGGLGGPDEGGGGLAYDSVSSCGFLKFICIVFMYLCISLCLVSMVEERREEGETTWPSGRILRRPLPHPWFMVPFPVVLLVFGHLHEPFLVRERYWYKKRAVLRMGLF